MRRIGNVEYPQLPVSNVCVVIRERNRLRAARHCPGSEQGRAGRIGDIDDYQPLAGGGDISLIVGNSNVIGQARCCITANRCRAVWIAYIDNLHTLTQFGDIGVVAADYNRCRAA